MWVRSVRDAVCGKWVVSSIDGFWSLGAGSQLGGKQLHGREFSPSGAVVVRRCYTHMTVLFLKAETNAEEGDFN